MASARRAFEDGRWRSRTPAERKAALLRLAELLEEHLLELATAVIEMASASGLHLVPRDRRDATRSSSRGTGELIRAALDAGARKIILGLGGSATNDAGAGLLGALGVRFLAADMQKLRALGIAVPQIKRDGIPT